MSYAIPPEAVIALREAEIERLEQMRNLSNAYINFQGNKYNNLLKVLLAIIGYAEIAGDDALIALIGTMLIDIGVMKDEPT